MSTVCIKCLLYDSQCLQTTPNTAKSFPCINSVGKARSILEGLVWVPKAMRNTAKSFPYINSVGKARSVLGTLSMGKEGDAEYGKVFLLY
jgi:hypothetical protein